MDIKCSESGKTRRKKKFRAVKNGLIAKEKDEESCELYIIAGF